MAKLVLLQGGEATAYALNDLPVQVGRHPDCEIQLDSNMVSRFHARVSADGDLFQIEDLGSGNGTFVNGKRIEGALVLKNGDRIKLGPLLLRFEESAPLKSSPGRRTESMAVGDGSSFMLDMSGDDGSTIMGSADAKGFGLLDVRPEVKLKGVLEISRSLAGTIDLETLLPRMLDTLFEIFPQADRGSILLKDLQSDRLIPAAQKHRQGGRDETVRMSRTILEKVLAEKTAILSADAANDERFDASESISSLVIRSMMCVPMLDLQGNPSGVINLDTQNALRKFTQEDLDLLLAVAGQAALTYESARLLTSHLQKQKQDSEMNVAMGVQHALLPDVLPTVPGYEFFASYDSAQAVGGDYYDCFMLGEDKVCISFGDVAGKGVPGALIMSRMSSVVQSTMSFTHDVGEAVASINKQMCHKMVEGRFVTYVLAVLDLNTHEITLVNAGHMSPLIRKGDGSIDEFDENLIGVPVGIMEEYPYEIATRTIEPGEMIVLITDGVDEAMDPDGNLYTKNRVVEFVSSNSSSDAEELGTALLADVRKHANGRDQNDDITIMTFSRNSE
jgi:serine phosphatase RsbU (regulator of sigma subunit)/pSer/pThr/pTyr-binding forkhead associated (FHA) protein